MQPSILIVDDETRLAEVMSVALDSRGFDATFVDNVEAALGEVEAGRVDLILTDLRMSPSDGRDLLHAVRGTRPDIPVVIMTAYSSVRDAVELVKEGAFDYIGKPFEVEDLVATVGRALQLRQVVEENEWLRNELGEKYSFEQLIGHSPAFQEMLRQVTDVCGGRSTVLLQGESGTGKELVARAVHFNSPRRAKPFVAVNCAAIPEGLLESELFGHAKGAFTGAIAAREGRFLAADAGTIFLDEIGDMPLPTQAKVLRVLQHQSFEPVGTDRTVKVDVRIVVATHKNLRQMVTAGQFREDLFYRLNVFPIALPPLRERCEDVSLLANSFLQQHARDMGKRIVGFSPAAEAAMAAYSWPGNIRELQNCVERAVIVARGNAVDLPDLPRYIFAPYDKEATAPSLPHDLDAELRKIERGFILEALREADGVQVKAAQRLGIAERSLWHRIKKLGIRINRTAASI